MVTLGKTAKELGWSYLRGSNLGKFNELALSYATKYALTKNDFKEPAAPLKKNFSAAYRAAAWGAIPLLEPLAYPAYVLPQHRLLSDLRQEADIPHRCSPPSGSPSPTAGA